MSMFAMALPYTDCHKYSLYIVTMAHQVIADWFTRCKLVFRKDFVSLIVTALRSNSISNILDSNNSVNGGAKDELKSVPTPISGKSVGKRTHQQHQRHKEQEELQNDMTDVCLDMMARYSFSFHHGQPKRSPLVDFLLAQGSSQTWLVGNMLVTVTTSDSVESQGCDCFKWTKQQKLQQQRKQHGKLTLENTMKGNVSGSDTFERQNEQINAGSSLSTGAAGMNRKKKLIATNSSSSAKSIGMVTSVSSPNNNTSSKPIHLTKLTQKIVEQNESFSPSEKLLFSRQASKAVSDGIAEEDDEDGFSDGGSTSSLASGSCGSGSDAGVDDEYNVDKMMNACTEDPIFPHDVIHKSGNTSTTNNSQLKDVVSTNNHTFLNKSLQTSAVSEKASSSANNNINNSYGNNRNTTTSESKYGDSAGASQRPFIKPSGGEDRPTYSRPQSPSPSSLLSTPPKLDCRCVCSGWAEIVIQRPSGKVSWVMKLENREVMKGNDFADLMLLRKCLNDNDDVGVGDRQESGEGKTSHPTPSISGVLLF